MPEQVGTVELLKVRIYPIDPKNHADDRAEVIVQPGTYPLYCDHGVYYWMMTGEVNTRGFRKIGDGMFSMTPWDQTSGVEVTFPSDRFGSEQFTDFRNEPVCTKGHPD
jgi:hypothetical protein